MTLKRFDPEKRKMILALDKASFDTACRSSKTGDFLHDDAVQIIPLPLNDENRSHPIVQQLAQNNLLVSGTLLAEDPFHAGSYLPLERFAEQTQLTKAELFALLCQTLGAKKVIFHVNQSSDKNQNAKAEAEVTGTMGDYADIDTSARAGLSEKLYQKLTANHEYDGHEPTAEDFLAAEALIQRHRLDSTFKHILESRKHKNAIKQSKVSLELSSETDKTFNIATKFSIKITEELAGIKGSLNINSKNVQKLTIETTVVFA